MIIYKPQRRKFSKKKGGTEIHETGRAQNCIQKRIHKYGAVKTEFGGRSFPSQLQANTFGLLRILEAAGEIKNIRHEVEVRLVPFQITMRVDFVVFDIKLGEDVYVEAKGFPTADWKIKVRVWEWVGPGLYRVYVQGPGGGYPQMKKETRPAWMNSERCPACDQPICFISHHPKLIETQERVKP